jgi:hypothetical protein
MRNPLNDAPPARGATGSRLPKFPLPGGAAAVAVILAITFLVWKAYIAAPAPVAPKSVDEAAAKAAARAMTFTQSPEPKK